jgi:hypothetical protein
LFSIILNVPLHGCDIVRRVKNALEFPSEMRNALKHDAHARAGTESNPTGVVSMHFRFWALAPLAAVAIAVSAHAVPNLLPSEEAAKQACGTDEVVFVDLDRGRYYHKAQASYGKSKNGGYVCQATIKGQWRESHD